MDKKFKGIFFLKKKKKFEDGNFVDTDVEIKIKLHDESDDLLKVESSENDVKRIFWIKREELITELEKNS